MAKKSGLGKGLDSLIPPTKNYDLKADKMVGDDDGSPSEGWIKVKLSKIEPDRNQPRKNFKEDELNELAESIKSLGLIEPIVVQKRKDGYEIVTGERRWRAAKIAGLTEIPVVVREYSKEEKVLVQLVENIQRESLDPIEEAMTYKRFLTEFNLKQDELAEKIGKNRTTITNSMRLLNLDERVQKMITDEIISAGHARPLLAIEDKDKQFELANKILDEELSVRETEKLIKSLKKPKKPKKQTEEALQLIYRKYEDELREALGAKVEIVAKDNEKGRIEIEYYSQDEFENLVRILKSSHKI